MGYAGGLRGEWEMFRMKMLAVTGTWQIKRLSHSLTVVLNPGQDCPPPGGKKCGDRTAMTVAGVKILVINGQGVGMPHLVMALSTRCMRPFEWQQSPQGDTPG